MKMIDLSQPIESGMPVFPGDRAVNLVRSHILARDGYNNHHLETGMHVGTHIDGPMHMTDVCKYMADMPLENFCGEGCILSVPDEKVIRGQAQYEEKIKGKEIVLIHTGMDLWYRQKRYYTNYPVLDMSFCHILVKYKVRMVGIDAPSPDKPPFLVHQYLMDNDIMILENLTNLDRLNSEQSFEVIAFPLKIMADASMTRAVARIY